MCAILAGDADLFLLALAFSRRLEQAEHRLRDIRITDEHPLDRTHFQRARSSRDRQVGGVEIDDVAARVGDREAIKSMIGDPAHHRIVGRAIGKTNHAGGKGEQIEQADHRQQRQQPHNIRLRLRPAERHERNGRRDDAAGDQQHQQDTAATPRRHVDGHKLS